MNLELCQDKESEHRYSVLGISGIVDTSFIEGYDPIKKVFDKTKTQMEERRYLNYCRIKDPDLKKLIFGEGRIVDIRSLGNNPGIDAIIEGCPKVWSMDELEPLMHAMSYPLHYLEREKEVYPSGRPLLIAFPIGSHRLQMPYISDRSIGSSQCFSSDYDASSLFGYYQGYHLEPGIVAVDTVYEIQELEAEPDRTFAKPFRLIDVTDSFH